jgi:acyl-CoA dehydrogenase
MTPTASPTPVKRAPLPPAELDALCARVRGFIDDCAIPAEDMSRAHDVAWLDAVTRRLRAEATARGLIAPQLPIAAGGMGLCWQDCARVFEECGRSFLGAGAMGCAAPDQPNIDTLTQLAAPSQRERWLAPLMAGEIRSAFAMTEPGVASSDATNIESSIVRDGDDYVLNGRKWWTSGANDPRCKVLIFMGKSDPDNADRHKQQTMLVVPMNTPGVKVLRHLPVFGYDDAPHGHAEVDFKDVRVSAADSLLLGEGRGFEIAQGRLGPGRIHHCMRLIGVAERALEKMCQRTLTRVTFGKPVAEQTVTLERIAEARIRIDQTRLLVLNAAWLMDTVGNKAARKEIAMIKVAAATMACDVVDWAIQAHGGCGVTEDSGLPHLYASSRTLRIADGPDEVHRNQIGKMELARHKMGHR